MISEIILSVFASIGYVNPNPTFERDIRPIFKANCTECHGNRWDNVFVVRSWSDFILDKTVIKQTMPPYKPLLLEERALIRQWIQNNMPE
jgi:mono/diheme cytochrome c family protein